MADSEESKETKLKEEQTEAEHVETEPKKKKKKRKKNKTHHEYTVPDEHQQVVAQLQAALKDTKYTQYHADVGQIHRFLVSRDLDVIKAKEMALKYYEWWESFLPHQIPVGDIDKELKTGKFIILGHDKTGRPMCLFRGHRHMPGEFPSESTWKTIHFLLQRAIRKCKPGQSKLLLMFEQHGMGWKNFDKSLVQIGGILEAYYPERVGNIVIMDPDWLFSLLWKIVRPLFPPATAQKIVLVDGDPAEALLKYADRDQIWSRYGGEWKAPAGRREMFGLLDSDEELVWKKKK